jgi:hypothetical protein
MTPRVQSAEERKYLQTATFRLVRDESGKARKAGGRLRPRWQRKMPICRMFSAGATGLEPATSGVTGRYELDRHNRLRPRITGLEQAFPRQANRL